MPRLLITAGPTQEPLDTVRYLGNRSSGRLGVALAAAAAERGWPVTLLLGPSCVPAPDAPCEVHRFRTTAELQALLESNQEFCDALVMAAAVADYRPRVGPDEGKWRRGDGPRTLLLDPTPDLLAACAGRRPNGQVLIGFALEPERRMVDSAREKLARKGVDVVIANPLETIDSDGIEAVAVGPATTRPTPGRMTKDAFSRWLLDLIEEVRGGSTL